MLPLMCSLQWIMQSLSKANTFGPQHNFQSKIFYLMLPMPRIIYPCPDFICRKIMVEMSESLPPCVICLFLITMPTFFECCCTTTFIEHPHKGEVHWLEELWVWINCKSSNFYFIHVNLIWFAMFFFPFKICL